MSRTRAKRDVTRIHFVDTVEYGTQFVAECWKDDKGEHVVLYALRGNTKEVSIKLHDHGDGIRITSPNFDSLDTGYYQFGELRIALEAAQIFSGNTFCDYDISVQIGSTSKKTRKYVKKKK